MTCSPSLSSSSTSPSASNSRKRSMSFSAPLPPQKSARTLRRTGSYLSLEDMQTAVETTLYGRNGAPSSLYANPSAGAPHTRSLRHYKDERDRRKATLRSSNTVVQMPSITVTTSHIPSRIPIPRLRTSSPLAPAPSVLPARTAFPRSKPEPDLYRVAITTRMRMSPEGRKILYMGPRLALSMLTATQELERSLFSATTELEQIVAAQRDADNDIVMADCDVSLGKSWVVVSSEDWEMIDRGA
ncbi:uncharacterized protein FIBRA_07185 [Fibroporia radiculosa]|uniref:Uncharacterized protein n=1 Tax=Fibroporia radiculosa TaxID=599839 RepID=J4I0A3_9APHY|nr:uncharacterized protein FIBRA_07185 [Fibroporia radiculosa]CCM04987.1 predicted protein [Fibroporia radiculosa]